MKTIFFKFQSSIYIFHWKHITNKRAINLQWIVKIILWMFLFDWMYFTYFGADSILTKNTKLKTLSPHPLPARGMIKGGVTR